MPVLEVAESNGIAVVEDAAHAPGARRASGQSLGTFGAIGCFSFFANKNVPVGRERNGRHIAAGGSAERLALLRSHGMTTLTWQRHTGSRQQLRRRRGRGSTTASTSCAPRRWRAVQLAKLERVRRRAPEARGCTTANCSTEPREIAIPLPWPRWRGDDLLAPSRRRACSPEGIEPGRGPRGACGLRGSRRAFTTRRFTGSAAYADIGSSRELTAHGRNCAERIVTLPLYPHIARRRRRARRLGRSVDAVRAGGGGLRATFDISGEPVVTMTPARGRAKCRGAWDSGGGRLGVDRLHA